MRCNLRTIIKCFSNFERIQFHFCNLITILIITGIRINLPKVLMTPVSGSNGSLLFMRGRSIKMLELKKGKNMNKKKTMRKMKKMKKNLGDEHYVRSLISFRITPSTCCPKTS